MSIFSACLVQKKSDRIILSMSYLVTFDALSVLPKFYFTAKVLLPKVQVLVFAFIVLKAPIEYLIHPLVIILSVLFVVIDMISILRHSLQAKCIV